jgi:large subunit ribosomal protein L33
MSTRVNITLACVETGDRDYTATKSKKAHPERLEMRKYCPRLRRHVLYRETK